MRIILKDKIDLNMFERYPLKLILDKINKEEACFNIEFAQEEGELFNEVQDLEFLAELSDYCGFVISDERKDYELRETDRIYIPVKEKGKMVFYELLMDYCLLD